MPRRRVEGLGRQVDRGEPPITCQHCRGQCLIIPSLLAPFHAIYHSHHLLLCGSYQKRERRGPEGIYVDKYVENWLSMDLFARADLFVWRQTEVAFVCLPAEPWLSPSMARHSGDKHQLAGPLHRHQHFLPESADYILEVDSLLSLWIAGGLNLLFFSGLALG